MVDGTITAVPLSAAEQQVTGGTSQPPDSERRPKVDFGRFPDLLGVMSNELGQGNGRYFRSSAIAAGEAPAKLRQ